MTHSCPCGNPVRVTGPIATGFVFGPPECNLAYHWGCAEKLGVPRPKNTIEILEHHLRDVLACWCAGIPMEERREIRDNAISFLANMKNGMNPPNAEVMRAGEAGSASTPC